jgi:hypothetical protein
MTPEEVELLSELTIVIPTYNRPLELERTIEYWRDLPVTVHILDGSERPFFVEGLQSGTQSTYYHSFPSDGESAQENWSRRLKFGLSLMNTRFSALCCDDDVFTTDGMIKALEILDLESFDAVAGKTGEYLIRNDHVVWKHKYPNWKDEERQKSFVINERLLFDGGPHAFYAIYKSDKLKNIHSLGHSNNFPVPVWRSMLIINLIKIFCRIKFIDDLFWLKCGINYPEARPIKFAQLFWDENFMEHKKLFEDNLSSAIQISEPNMSSAARSELLNTFIAQFQKPKKSKKVVIKVKAKILEILGSLPRTFRKLLFSVLSPDLKKRLGNYDFPVNYSPIISLTEYDLSSLSLKNWEQILLMPREELRLRANI